MKKIITLFALMLCLCATAQQAVGEYMYIHRNNNTVERILLSEVDSVTFVEILPTPQYEAIDLGLPSGLKWASFNVGATKPEELGGYYAWGETEEKDDYSWSTYKWCNGTSRTMTKYSTDSYYGTVDNKTVLDLEDDVAHVKWGGNWRMPSLDEIKELRNNCTWQWTSVNGVDGYKVIGTNGNSIFLPATGYRYGLDVFSGGEYGEYWSTTLLGTDNSLVSHLGFADDNYGLGVIGRSYGLTVRPVCDETSNPDSGNLTYTVNGVSFTMVSVAGGTFQMGATSGHENYAYDDEYPVHNVTLSDYYIGETEVTQELWVAVMGSNPSYFTGNMQYPVEYVSWNECQEFISKLNALTGENFKLPTEAQWEYAARGGNKASGYLYSGSNNIGDVAWYNNNSNDKTHAVKTKAPNELGIYDMSGNVYEWCSDWYGNYSSSSVTDPVGPSSGSYRVLRGGSWYDYAEICRVAFRFYSSPVSRLNFIGLRLAR